MIELQFPAIGDVLPADHAYPLYAGLCRVLPELHIASCAVRIGPVTGTYFGNGQLHLDRGRSRVRLRTEPEGIPGLLPLAGKSIDVAGHTIRLGVPQVQALLPAASLWAKVVTIKGFTEPDTFLDAVRRQLDELGVTAEAAVPLVSSGPHEGRPTRRIVRVKDRKVVGFALIVQGLSAADSVKLQEQGLGGRPKMGCGFFVPMGRDQS